ncbi:MAG TPA: PspC domain-containing protein [Actinomycetales bacterium]|nr:PspC domain-containing protein [Actinomycetales bacterium]
MPTSPRTQSRPAAAPARSERLRRVADGRLLGGVAAGVAEHLGLPVLHVRIAFAVLAGLGGFGVAVYGALWVFAPVVDDDEPAGLAAASRTGWRPLRAVHRGDLGQLVALGALALGLVLLLTRFGWGPPPRVLFPMLIVGAGLALIWAQADVTDRARTARAAREPASGPNRPLTVLRIVGGVGLVGVGLLTLVVGHSGPPTIGDTLLLLGVVVVGLGLVVGPFLWRLVQQVDAERREKLLSQQQADVAAHLHDSVLQTLALIQRKADDPRAVVALARAQERDLRSWLYEDAAEPASSLRAALEEAAAEVETLHGVPVEVVLVGDAPVDEALVAVVRASREAMLNAARHSGAPAVDVYAEVEGRQVDVFVRDRGSGFDPAAVPSDRLGLRGSVVGRMERHGGRATVKSAPGDGTEVHLSMELGATSHGAAADDPEEEQ